ncbi:MAG: CaiB/BaiF CoA-transferase family protein [Pseudomonadota bacterium]
MGDPPHGDRAAGVSTHNDGPSGELAGLLVVAIEQAVAAPYASSRLADAGARVIKIERAEGDFARGYDGAAHGQSSYFVWLNRGKQSIALDLKDANDLALLRRMIARADVVIQNLAVGALGRLGLAMDDLRSAHPSLITCSITGYGESGPRAHLKAYDLLVQAESGLAAITGAGEHMARVGVSACDIAAGMTAHAAILQALIGRSLTGQGRHIAVSLYHALADWMSVPMIQHDLGGITPPRHGLAHHAISPYGAYPCGDGALLLIAIQNEREWGRFVAEILEEPDLADDPAFATNMARTANREAVDAKVAARFARSTSTALAAALEAAAIAYGRVTPASAISAHPQNRFITVETPNGAVQMMAPGATHDGRARAARRVPALNADGAALREEFSA